MPDSGERKTVPHFFCCFFGKTCSGTRNHENATNFYENVTNFSDNASRVFEKVLCFSINVFTWSLIRFCIAKKRIKIGVGFYFTWLFILEMKKICNFAKEWVFRPNGTGNKFS